MCYSNTPPDRHRRLTDGGCDEHRLRARFCGDGQGTRVGEAVQFPGWQATASASCSASITNTGYAWPLPGWGSDHDDPAHSLCLSLLRRQHCLCAVRYADGIREPRTTGPDHRELEPISVSLHGGDRRRAGADRRRSPSRAISLCDQT